MSYAEQPTETAFVVVVAWIVYFDFIDVLFSIFAYTWILTFFYAWTLFRWIWVGFSFYGVKSNSKSS